MTDAKTQQKRAGESAPERGCGCQAPCNVKLELVFERQVLNKKAPVLFLIKIVVYIPGTTNLSTASLLERSPSLAIAKLPSQPMGSCTSRATTKAIKQKR